MTSAPVRCLQVDPIRALLFVVLLFAGCVAPAASTPPAVQASGADAADAQALAEAVAAAVRSGLREEDRALTLDVESVEASAEGWTVAWSLSEGYTTPVKPSGVLRVELYDAEGLAAVREAPVSDVAPRYERWVATTFVARQGVREATSGVLHARLNATLEDGRAVEEIVGDYESVFFAPVLRPFAERFAVEVVAWGAEEDGEDIYSVWVHLHVRCLVLGPEARLDPYGFTMGGEPVDDVEQASGFERGYGGPYYEDGDGMVCEETPEDDLVIERWDGPETLPSEVGYDLDSPWDVDPSWTLEPAKRTDERPPFDT